MSPEDFEKDFAKRVNSDKTSLKLHCISGHQIPFMAPKDTSTAQAYYDRLNGNWPRHEDRLPSGVVVLKDKGFNEYQPVTKHGFLIDTGGIYTVQVYNGIQEDGKVVAYDGLGDGILNRDNQVLFTHEFLQSYWNQSTNGRISGKGYFRSIAKQWRKSLYNFRGIREADDKWELLNRPSLADVFWQSCFDYITLVDVPYEELFRCQCGDSCENESNITLVYDNCCNFLDTLLLRLPSLAATIIPIIDALHHSGHKNCSPFFNHKLNTFSQHINAAINEQKNRILNYMRTSASHMTQIRAMVYFRYHMAVLNMTQRALNEELGQLRKQPNKSLVCDGVSVCIPKKNVYIQRPYEQPHNLPAEGCEVPLKNLHQGCEQRNTLMITLCKYRQDALGQLVQGKAIAPKLWSDFCAWMDRNERSFLKHYITTEEDEEGKLRLKGDVHTKRILPVLAHWASAAGEIKLIPPTILEQVQGLVDSSGPPVQMNLGGYGDALHLLWQHDLATRSNATSISTHLRDLLKISLKLCRASIVSEKPAETQPWDRPEQQTDFEEMVRTCVYAPNHPVIRRLPHFRQDKIAEYSRTASRRKADKRRAQGDSDVLDELTKQSKIVGVVCTKYKTKYRALTPGVFTVFCGGCGMCEAFEIMMCAESPLTPFRMFAHRAWSPADLAVWKKWQDERVWQDCIS